VESFSHSSGVASEDLSASGGLCALTIQAPEFYCNNKNSEIRLSKMPLCGAPLNRVPYGCSTGVKPARNASQRPPSCQASPAIA